MKIKIQKDRIRLQSETAAESQVISEMMDKLWNPRILARIPEDVANDHGCRKVGGEWFNWLTLPLAANANDLQGIL